MPIWPFRNAPPGDAKTREELSRQYLRELQEMVDDRQIGPELAKQMLEEMFDPPRPWQPRIVTQEVWAAYLDQRARERRP